MRACIVDKGHSRVYITWLKSNSVPAEDTSKPYVVVGVLCRVVDFG